MKEKVEFRVDGYTLIDEIELDFDPETDSGTAYIPRVYVKAGLFSKCTELITTFESFWHLIDLLLVLIGKSRYDVDDYIGFMRRDLSMVWMYRFPDI